MVVEREREEWADTALAIAGGNCLLWHSKWQPQLFNLNSVCGFSIVVRIECDSINLVSLIDLPELIIN